MIKDKLKTFVYIYNQGKLHIMQWDMVQTWLFWGTLVFSVGKQVPLNGKRRIELVSNSVEAETKTETEIENRNHFGRL